MDRYLVTGALGCIGAWVTKQLLDEGCEVLGFDASDQRHRLRYLVPETHPALSLRRGDVTDPAFVDELFRHEGISHVIHLAALQVPFCKADPSLGASVNVVGTVNIFEAARRSGLETPVVYASSVATFDAVEHGNGAAVPPEHPSGNPGTLYGVWKRANEGTAHVYDADHGVRSVGLRPYVVYGVGRDQGMTSEPTQAMLAAVLGRPFEISYGGVTQMQHCRDAAAAFVAAARSTVAGAHVANLGGPAVAMRDVVAAIHAQVPGSRDLIRSRDVALPFPDSVDSSALAAVIGELPQLSIEEGVAETVERFRSLAAHGTLLASPDLS